MSEYLSDEEQAARLRSWWVANGLNVLIVSVLTIGGFVGYRSYSDSAQESAEASTAALADYQEADAAERALLGQKLVEQFMTEDIQIGGTADEKLQSQLYIGK